MSNTGVKETLARDLDDYTCGRLPSPTLKLPCIEFWETEVRPLGKAFKLVVRGRGGHPEIEDSEPFCSAAVMWFDRKNRWFRTTENTYALGEPNLADDGDAA